MPDAAVRDVPSQDGLQTAAQDDKGTELRLAARSGDAEEVRAILDQISGSEALSALLSSSDNISGNRALHYCSANGHMDVLRLLIEAGAELDYKNLSGSTALHYSAVNGHVECARALLEAKADPFAENKAGATALDEALRSRKSQELVDLLSTWAENVARSVDAPTDLRDLA